MIIIVGLTLLTYLAGCHLILKALFKQSAYFNVDWFVLVLAFAISLPILIIFGYLVQPLIEDDT